LTIIWHVDYLKISHVDKYVIEDIIRQLNAKLGKQSPLATTHGKVLEYYGMTLDNSTNGRLKYQYMSTSKNYLVNCHQTWMTVPKLWPLQIFS